jgi:regulator of RNase E activity RraA
MVGAEGVITDGGIRDVKDILSYGYKVFAAGNTPAARQPYLVSHSYNEDIACGGITVRPGDLMVAEDDSIVCVPAQLAGEVIDWAEEHEEVEEVIKDMIIKEGVAPGKYYNPENFERLKKQRRG